jgi:hypothetical protein
MATLLLNLRFDYLYNYLAIALCSYVQISPATSNQDINNAHVAYSLEILDATPGGGKCLFRHKKSWMSCY